VALVLTVEILTDRMIAGTLSMSFSWFCAVHAVLSSVCTTLVGLLLEQNEIVRGILGVYVCFHIYLRMYLLC